MRIVLLGAPGSGKGTQCKSIVEEYGLLHLSSGDILRQERAADSELGHKAQSYMDSGALVPDEIIIEMMAKAIEKAPDAGFVLDGFPRTVNQAEELIQRPDDTLEVVANRLETYHRQTEPLVDYYKNNGAVFEIDAGRSADEVKTDLFAQLNDLVKT